MAEVVQGTFDGDRVCTIKIVSGLNQLDPKQLTDIERELATLRKVEHPNLVEYTGSIRESDSIQIMMEFCSGGSLKDLIYQNSFGGVTWPQKIKVARDVASGMAYLHAQDPMIIHRNLDMTNVLLALRVATAHDIPMAKVGDFGLSRTLADEAAPLTVQKGNNACCAPEMLEGSQYDEKVDLFAYGMLLYEMICETAPFSDRFSNPSTDLRVSLIISAGERPCMDDFPEDCPAVLTSFMVSSWGAEPTERPGFDMVLSGLEALLAAEPLL
eukprot:gb/GFBE01038315.1/.p1 GENE.gb/GFBE01038315.1/~~gb/GFBE01038315.1/.p1  ORF type:complete len:270 (+),score=51.87 gb/GFBE01038315.1/:1-810(+)